MQRSWTVTLWAVAPLLCGLAAVAAEPPDPSAEVIVLRRCVVEYDRTAMVGPSIYGVLQERLVEPGDRVKAGQLLGRLRDDDARAEVELRESEANNDVEVRLSQARSGQALSKLRTTETLWRRNAASREELNLQRLEAESAALMVEQAQHRHHLAQAQLRQAQALARAREFVSPHDGVVVAVLKQPGEPVSPNEPVFRVVNADRLQIVGQLDVTDAWQARVGQNVRVVPEVAGADLAIEREVFTGRIVFVDSHVDPLSRTSKVLAKVENRDGLLRSGLEARMEILPAASTAPKAATRPPKPTPTPAAGALR